MKPIVAIVGRPNTGKSTLFNRLIGRRRAITKNEPGTTRDVNYADSEDRGKTFTLVDTGGFEPTAKTGILKQVKEQTKLAIEEANLIIFFMDGRAGVTPQDRELVSLLRKTGKKVIYAVNKIDTKTLAVNINEFYSLGIDNILPVSAEHGIGISALLDAVVEGLPELEEEAEEERIKMAIVGRPNAGKSSLLNKLIGKQRAIVSEVPGTTRDSIDTPFEYGEKKYLLIDTAGIRKKMRISRTLEKYSVISAIRSIDRSDCVILVIDGKVGVEKQDEKIAGLIEKSGKPCIIVVNKWDIVEKDMHTAKLYTEKIHFIIPFLSFAPVLFTSALTGRGVEKIMATMGRLYEEANYKVKTSELNRLIQEFAARHKPPAYNGKEVKFYYSTQISTNPLGFRVFTNFPEGVNIYYRRYLINSLRDALEVKNVPIRVFFGKRR